MPFPFRVPAGNAIRPRLARRSARPWLSSGPIVAVVTFVAFVAFVALVALVALSPCNPGSPGSPAYDATIPAHPGEPMLRFLVNVCCRRSVGVVRLPATAPGPREIQATRDCRATKAKGRQGRQRRQRRQRCTRRHRPEGTPGTSGTPGSLGRMALPAADTNGNGIADPAEDLNGDSSSMPSMSRSGGSAGLQGKSGRSRPKGRLLERGSPDTGQQIVGKIIADNTAFFERSTRSPRLVASRAFQFSRTRTISPPSLRSTSCGDAYRLFRRSTACPIVAGNAQPIWQ